MTYQCEINLLTAIDWQRGSAVKLNELINLKQKWYEDNYCLFWNDWITDVFDLRTANEFGLSVWSIILDLPLFDQSEKSRLDYPAIYFGSNRKNFNNGNFGKNASTVDSLTVNQKRIMLQLKAFILNMSSSTYEINSKLTELFGFRQVYTRDNLDMTYTYVINDPELISFISVIEDYDLLPRPNCVSVDYIIGSESTPFLFGNKRDNFSRGNFHIGII